MTFRLLHGALFLLLFGTPPALAACSDDVTTDDEPAVTVPPAGNDDEEKEENTENNDSISMSRNITLTINGTTFAATLEDNEAARAFEPAHGQLPPGHHPDRRPDALRLVLRGALLPDLHLGLQLHAARPGDKPRRAGRGPGKWQRKNPFYPIAICCASTGSLKSSSHLFPYFFQAIPKGTQNRPAGRLPNKTGTYFQSGGC